METLRDEDRTRLFLEVIPRTMRAIRGEMRKVADGEFTVPQFRVLGRLARSPATNRELAEWMGVTAPTMTKMIDNLVRRGYVRRETEGPDRRQVILTCTRKGLGRAEQIRHSVQKSIAARIAALSEPQRRALAEGLLVMREMSR